MPIPLLPAGITGLGIAKSALGVLGGIFGSKNKKKQQSFDNRMAKDALALQQKNQALNQAEFDWRKQGDQWDMRHKDIEFGNKRSNQNARNPMARQVMAMLHKLGGYENLDQMDAYAKGQAVLPPSQGTQVPIPGEPAPQGPLPMQRPRPMVSGAMNAMFRPRPRVR